MVLILTLEFKKWLSVPDLVGVGEIATLEWINRIEEVEAAQAALRLTASQTLVKNQIFYCIAKGLHVKVLN